MVISTGDLARTGSLRWRSIGYWCATAVVVGELALGGVWDIERIAPVRNLVAHLGYPSYFLVLLGTWKILGAVALLMPRRALLKEWAYAGTFFVYTGAIVSHLAHRLQPGGVGATGRPDRAHRAVLGAATPQSPHVGWDGHRAAGAHAPRHRWGCGHRAPGRRARGGVSHGVRDGLGFGFSADMGVRPAEARSGQGSRTEPLVILEPVLVPITAEEERPVIEALAPLLTPMFLKEPPISRGSPASAGVVRMPPVMRWSRRTRTVVGSS
jgi:hypothetical protein